MDSHETLKQGCLHVFLDNFLASFGVLTLTVQVHENEVKMYSHRRWLEAGNFRFRKKKDDTIHLVKIKALISCAVTAQLICALVFVAYAKSRFSYDI